jgi:hypothetical protein
MSESYVSAMRFNRLHNALPDGVLGSTESILSSAQDLKVSSIGLVCFNAARLAISTEAFGYLRKNASKFVAYCRRFVKLFITSVN